MSGNNDNDSAVSTEPESAPETLDQKCSELANRLKASIKELFGDNIDFILGVWIPTGDNFPLEVINALRDKLGDTDEAAIRSAKLCLVADPYPGWEQGFRLSLRLSARYADLLSAGGGDPDEIADEEDTRLNDVISIDGTLFEEFKMPEEQGSKEDDSDNPGPVKH